MALVKSTYIVCCLVFMLAMITLAVAAPVWITPGYYWWTAFGIFGAVSQSNSFVKRLNSWGGCGEV